MRRFGLSGSGRRHLTLAGLASTLAFAVLPFSGAAQERPESALRFLSDRIQASLQLELPDDAALADDRAVQRLVSEPLTAATAAQIALHKNPALVALYERLPADAPPSDPDAVLLEVERHPHVTALKRGLSQAADAAETYEAQKLIVDVTADAERAFYRAVAARQLLDLRSRIGEAASISSELRELQSRTGGATKRIVAEAALYEAELSLQSLKARSDADRSRQALLRILGLPLDTVIQLPDRLPDLPDALPAIAPAQASAGRPDVLASTWRGIAEYVEGQLEAITAIPGADRERQPAPSRPGDREIELEIGQLRSDYGSAFEAAVVMTRDILPLGRAILEERLLEYNGMLIDVIDLIAAARDELTREMDAVVSQRDFFIARADLRAAAAGSLPSPNDVEPSRSEVREAADEH